ncbi:COPI-interacting protein CEX1 [Sporobolomyces koalae]|uniref:COPI-interacting protein CEX1 n=1 Tax=Sporobolomyces koalae TaxID=500713 RepID=UPI003177D891
MNFLSSLSSAVISASSAALSNATSQIPGVSGYTLGERAVPESHTDSPSIWTRYSGIKRDDQTQVSIFQFEAGSNLNGIDRRALLPLARNSFRKLRSTRHPNILKFLDGSESDSAVWIITEPVEPLSTATVTSLSEESKTYGLLHLATALSFLNLAEGGKSVHAGLQHFHDAVWITKGGEWKLGGFELCSRLDDREGAMWNHGGMMPESKLYASPEVRRGGWTALKEHDPSAYDSYLLHLLIFQLFNGPLPNSFLSPTSDTPSLSTTARGSIPPSLFQAWRRLGSPNPATRLKTGQFLEMALAPTDGWATHNRLVKLSTALEGFSLASENERTTLVRTLKAISSASTSDGTNSTSASPPLPTGFLLYKILPSLLHTFEFSSASSSSLLPLILSLSTSLPSTEYSQLVVPPLLRMFQLPDRAMRMALLEGLELYADKLTSKDVVERVWPYLVTGFGDVVPVIREATVKSILIIAPKLNDRILNNDLLRYLSRTQTDSEPGIRTNTCILLSRLSPHLSSSTRRKVLIPAFARSLRDPFVHARIAGLCALMAGTGTGTGDGEGWDKEDLALKVIPSIGVCLVDKEKIVRDQGFKAIDMFVKRCEQLTASMPETVLPPNMNGSDEQPVQLLPPANAATATAAVSGGVKLATNAAGAAGVLAGWAFGGVGKKLSTAELSQPIERRSSTPALPQTTAPTNSESSMSNGNTLPGGFEFGEPQVAPATTAGQSVTAKDDWGPDLMDVNDDTQDWDEFESGQPRPPSNRPLTSKPKPMAGKRVGGSMRLGGASKSSALRVPMDMDATDSWDLDLNEDESALSTTTRSPAAPIKGLKPKPASLSSLSVASTPSPSSTLQKPRVPSKLANDSAAPSRRTASSSSTSSNSHFRPPAILIPPPYSTESGTASAVPTDLRSPLPPLATPPLAPVAPDTSTLPMPLMPITPLSAHHPPPPAPPAPPPNSGPVPTSSSSDGAAGAEVLPRPVSPALIPTPILPSTPTLTGLAISSESGTPTITTTLTKEEKAAKLALAREERRKRMAAAKSGK